MTTSIEGRMLGVRDGLAEMVDTEEERPGALYRLL
jgi:hypothetical protein